MNYTEFTKNATFEGLRLGVPRKVFFDPTFVDAEVVETVKTAIRKISALGATIQDPADLPSINELLSSQAEAIVLRKFLFTSSHE